MILSILVGADELPRPVLQPRAYSLPRIAAVSGYTYL